MNNLDKIIEKITAEANDTAASILAAAAEQADEIEQTGRDRAEAITAAARARSERDRTAADARADGTADMKRREILLATKVGLINRAFEEAENYLYSLDRSDYIVFLGHLLADAISEQVRRTAELKKLYGDEDGDYSLDFEVVFNAHDRDDCAEDVVAAAREFLRRDSKLLAKKHIAISDVAANIRGGLILRCGDIDVNCSVSAVVGEMRSTLEADCAATLFAAEA